MIANPVLHSDLGVYPLSFCVCSTRRELYLENPLSRIAPFGESAVGRPPTSSVSVKEKIMLKSKIASGLALVGAGITNAIAAVPVDVTTALSDAKTDGVTVATAVLVAVVAIFAFKLMRRGL